METGTLKELNVKPGDVVEFCDNGVWYPDCVGHCFDVLPGLEAKSRENGVRFGITCVHRFRIMSRASDTRKVGNNIRAWGEMTDAERAEIALAFVDGRPIEAHDSEDWWECPEPSWSKSVAYRVRPEPVRETVTLLMHYAGDGHPFIAREMSDPTHQIDIAITNGEVTSIDWEKL